MASSSYLERKLKDLNCMKNNRMYGSLESFDSVEAPMKKKKKQFNLFRRLGKNSKASKADQFTVSYEQVLEHESADERTRLLESVPVGKKRYTNLDDDSICQESGKKAKKPKKSVKFLAVETSESAAANREGKKGKKKKSLLKRTGKLIVRTCRLMSYGTPYMSHMSSDFPYNNTRYPPDYRYYDFETKQYDFGYSNNYMGYNGCSPSVFF